MNIFKYGKIGLIFIFSQCVYAEMNEQVQFLQDRWAEINYEMSGDAKLKAFEDLIKMADKVTSTEPTSAEAWIWSGIIKSTYAGASGGLGALKWAKNAKSDLETAIKIDSQALQGSAYTSLGTLYFNVPGWPIGFGDDHKAEELLRQALMINPNGIDPNYFYADFLLSQKRFKEAEAALLIADAAPPRPNRAVADKGRHAEINEKLSLVRSKMGN